MFRYDAEVLTLAGFEEFSSIAEIIKYGMVTAILEFKKSSGVDLRFTADFVCEKNSLGYNKKQWGLTPEKLSEPVTRSDFYCLCLCFADFF